MEFQAGKFQVIMFLFQVVMFVLYGALMEYEESLESLPAFGLFQNVQVMIFVGFGFLMTFMRRYGWGATGFTMLFALVAAQFSIFLLGFFLISTDCLSSSRICDHAREVWAEAREE